MARWRLLTGIAILVALASFCALLIPPYLQNWRLQRFLEQIAFDASRQAQPETVYAAEIAELAARLGVPLPIDQVRVAKSPDGGVFLEARYLVHVDLLVYTVDLHFRPSAGAR